MIKRKPEGRVQGKVPFFDDCKTGCMRESDTDMFVFLNCMTFVE